MLWVALILPPRPPAPFEDPATAPPPHPWGICAEAQAGLAVWCLQFTPRVALMEDAVVMEVEASLRLFRGLPALKARLSDEAPDLGAVGIGWAPSATAALVLARCGVLDLGGRLLQAVLDPLPLQTLSAGAEHAEPLSRAGINTLGQLRALPRGGISRRFGAALLTMLDQAYGLRPEAHAWVALPEDFHARVELPSREDHAPALLLGVRPLLMRLCGWLAARHAGATGVTLHWVHDSMRAKDAGEGGCLTVRTAEPIRELEHFCRLMAEHLAKTQLLAPVGELRLEAVGVQALVEDSGSLLPDVVRTGETLYPPLRLAVRDHRPHYQGPLTLLVGPDRVEGGWWDRVPATDQQGQHHRQVTRDYWIAVNENAGVIAVYQQRVTAAKNEGDDKAAVEAWYLHGMYA